jgi:hypothetical protein
MLSFYAECTDVFFLICKEFLQITLFFSFPNSFLDLYSFMFIVKLFKHFTHMRMRKTKLILNVSFSFSNHLIYIFTTKAQCNLK